MISQLHLLLVISVICTLQLNIIANETQYESGRRRGGFYLWKDFPLDELAKSPKFRNFYTYCFGSEERCPIDGKPLIQIIPEMIKNNCSKCTSHQMYLANTVVTYLKERQPKEFAAFQQKYNPSPKKND